VEAWPFLLAGGLVLWRRAPGLRPALELAAVLVPAAWLVPEWLGSGDLLRSGARARVPNPGQPALADVPALASLRAAADLPLWPLWLGVAAPALPAVRRRDRSARAALAPAAAGAAWIAVVAAMAQAGFSGEPRYALPGAALIAVSGAAGLALALRPAAGAALSATAGHARLERRTTGPLPATTAHGHLGSATKPPLPTRVGYGNPGAPTTAPFATATVVGRSGARSIPPATAPGGVNGAAHRTAVGARASWRRRPAQVGAAVAVALVALPAGVRLADVPGLRDRQAYQWRLASELPAAIDAAGGRGAVLRCGTPYVGTLRGPLLAYRLHVAKAAVEPDAAPRAPGTVFRSALAAGAAPGPDAPAAFAPIARTPLWDVRGACGLRVP
jgi:hypothetical protein